ncbi:hypothetical protein B0H13DRAFT_1892854 [Mycena leptocephala]|nr:hypothetical protein B0H13DRAFT_1892854 [Mycena leptocephala]
MSSPWEVLSGCVLQVPSTHLNLAADFQRLRMSTSQVGNLDDLSRSELLTSSSRSTGFTGLPGRTPPRRRVTTCSMEEGQAAGNETHQMTDSSPIARIAALEQRIAALETVIKNMSHDSARQRPQTTDTLTTITPWRVLNSVIILGPCAYKALDWIIGVLWTLIVYWVSFFGDPTPGHSSWFFTSDLSGPMTMLLESVRVVVIFGALAAGVPAIFRLVFDRICHLAKSGFVQVILWSVFPITAALGAVPAICKLVFDRICHLAESGFAQVILWTALGAVPAICQLVFDGICHLERSGFVQVILWSLFPMTAALVIAAAIRGLFLLVL